MLLLFAGHETTTNLIGNGALALLQHPAEARGWRENPALVSSAVEELLRFDGPTPAMVRVAREELRIGDKDIGRGDRLFLMINAANRDPAQFSGAGPARPRARRTTATSRSATASTSAWARRWRGSRGSSRCRRCWRASRASVHGAARRSGSTRSYSEECARCPSRWGEARGHRRAPMPRVSANGIRLHYEETGAGAPLVFVHEFAGDAQSWHLQVRFFARRYRTIVFNARGYPPSDVPTDGGAYSQDHAVEDIRGLLDALGIDGRTSAGCRWAATRRFTSGCATRSGRCRWSSRGAGTGAWRRTAPSSSGTSRPRPSAS